MQAESGADGTGTWETRQALSMDCVRRIGRNAVAAVVAGAEAALTGTFAGFSIAHRDILGGAVFGGIALALGAACRYYVSRAYECGVSAVGRALGPRPGEVDVTPDA